LPSHFFISIITIIRIRGSGGVDKFATLWKKHGVTFVRDIVFKDKALY
jgi:hypothetical protein